MDEDRSVEDNAWTNLDRPGPEDAGCHLGHWRPLVEPVGLEPTLGFLPLIKSQVSASNSSTTPKLVGHREVESRPSG